MVPKNDRNFRKSDVSEAQIEFRRPCRGLSPFWQGRKEEEENDEKKKVSMDAHDSAMQGIKKNVFCPHIVTKVMDT